MKTPSITFEAEIKQFKSVASSVVIAVFFILATKSRTQQAHRTKGPKTVINKSSNTLFFL